MIVGICNAANPTFNSFNSNQFSGSSSANNIAVKSGALLTNVVASGTFTGDGSGLTNVTANTNAANVLTSDARGLTNTGVVNITNANNVIGGLFFKSLKNDLGARGGTNDDTAALQACSSQSVIVDISVTSSNVIFTNNTYLRGDGIHTLSFATNAVGNFIDCHASTNVVLDTLIIDGLSYDFEQQSSQYPWNVSGQNVTHTAPASPRGGVFMNNYYCALRFNSVIGFNEIALTFTGNGVAFPQPTNMTTKAVGNTVTRCYMGVRWTNNAEYMSTASWDIHSCGFGFYVGAGNVIVGSSEVTRCGAAVAVDGNVTNPAHGAFNGCIFNHCSFDSFLWNFNNEFLFNGCTWLGNGDAFWTNVAGVKLVGCVMGGTTYHNDGTGGAGGANWLIYPTYIGPMTIAVSNGGRTDRIDLPLSASGAPGIALNTLDATFSGTNVFTGKTILTNLNSTFGGSNVVATNQIIVGSTNLGAMPFGGSPTFGVWNTFDSGATSPAFSMIGNLIVVGQTSGTAGTGNIQVKYIDRGGSVYLATDPSNAKMYTTYSMGIGKTAPGTPLDVVGTITGGLLVSTNGYVSYSTNQFTFAATGWTNTTGSNCVVAAGSTAVAATLSDGTNTIRTTAVLTGELPAWILKPNWKVTASGGLAGVAYPQ